MDVHVSCSGTRQRGGKGRGAYRAFPRLVAIESGGRGRVRDHWEHEKVGGRISGVTIVLQCSLLHVPRCCCLFFIMRAAVLLYVLATLSRSVLTIRYSAVVVRYPVEARSFLRWPRV